MPISDLTGTTWVFNNTLNINFGGHKWFNINFRSNDDWYRLEFDPDGDEVPIMTYINGGTIPTVYYFGTWSNDAYKTITITGGTDATNANLIAWLEANATQQVAPQPSASISIGNLPIDKAYFGNNEVSAIYFGNVKVYESGPAIDPVFANNDWATIKSVAESGNASNYWNVGDTKTDLGVDGYTRTLRISDMSGLYNKHGVIEEVNTEGTDGSGSTGVVWNPNTNVDDNNCYNNYNISNMRTTVLPSVILRLSNELQAILTNTTYKVAKNGMSTTVLELSDKLFLPAAKELSSSPSYSRTEENSALTTWNYYTTHTTSSDRIKYNSSSTAGGYWLRSPSSGDNVDVAVVSYTGNFSDTFAYSTYRLGFAFAL